MVAEILEAVHHLDTAYAAFYTAMTTKQDTNSVHVCQGSKDIGMPCNLLRVCISCLVTLHWGHCVFRGLYMYATECLEWPNMPQLPKITVEYRGL